MWSKGLKGRDKKRLLIWISLGLAIITGMVIGWPPWSSQNVFNMPLVGQVIVIDPGHGGRDGGAVSKGGVVEKEVALAIALRLRDYLQESGALVIMTRETDRDLADEGTRRRKSQDLMRRAHLVKTSHANLFVSIHLNAVPSPRWTGAQTFYHPKLEANKKLAQQIQSELVRNLANTKRIAKQIGDIYVLKQSSVPSALVEVGFLSNPGEARKLADPRYQEKMAASIYNGILLYYSDQKEEEK